MNFGKIFYDFLFFLRHLHFLHNLSRIISQVSILFTATLLEVSRPKSTRGLAKAKAEASSANCRDATASSSCNLSMSFLARRQKNTRIVKLEFLAGIKNPMIPICKSVSKISRFVPKDSAEPPTVITTVPQNKFPGCESSMGWKRPPLGRGKWIITPRKRDKGRFHKNSLTQVSRCLGKKYIADECFVNICPDASHGFPEC